jgi:uncharacterized protein with NRDE domain
VAKGKKMLQKILSDEKDPSPDTLFSMLADRFIPENRELPETGVGLDWERILSPIFITSPDYGTRSSTLIFIDLNDQVTLIEKTFNKSPDHSTTAKHEFTIQT